MGMIGVATAVLSVLRSGRTVRQWRHVPEVSASSVDASVLAVVPARNEEATLPRLLPGLVGQPGVRVVVVDDASEDGTAAVARRRGGRVVRSGTWLGGEDARDASRRRVRSGRRVAVVRGRRRDLHA
ncbi:glycosyltransferase [Lentzea sp. BCCO 10_0061]|uniref:Glycosyltransferase n=1 Tax=Lentzea sokolovensis TaxID=3095429 RepID=A0ABU4V1X6_9PSEU|nr:glycosyltransferase [Lentzea sp. BCCO 10_0061]MDX8145783.1 glycosyltransferase [Lentzea sp. BCCO 10_0061]